MHLPLLWKFRLLRALHAKGNTANRQVLAVQARLEGGEARFNPLNTTEPWPHSWSYNSVGVRDYATAADGIAATAATFTNGLYWGIVNDLRSGKFTARQIIERNAAEYDKWGGPGYSTKLLALL